MCICASVGGVGVGVGVGVGSVVGQRVTSDTFLSHSAHYSLRQGLSIEPRSHR